MGNSSTLSQASTCSEISAAVSGIGASYEPYAKTILNEGINGNSIFTNDIKELITEVKVTNSFHEKRLRAEYEKLTGTNKSTTTSDGKVEVQTSIYDDQIELNTLINRSKKIRSKSIKSSSDSAELNHIFISYRVSTEKDLARELYLGIKAEVSERDFLFPGLKPKIYYDAESIHDGEDWEKEFVSGLVSSLLLLPVLSWHTYDTGSVGQLMSLSDKDRVDNCLLEWELGLILSENGNSNLKGIFPVMLGGIDSRGYLEFPGMKLAELPDKPSLKTKARLVDICELHGITLSESDVRRTVKEVVDALLKKQGVQMAKLGAPGIANKTCIKKAFDKSAEVLSKTGIKPLVITPTKGQEPMDRTSIKKQKYVTKTEKYFGPISLCLCISGLTCLMCLPCDEREVRVACDD